MPSLFELLEFFGLAHPSMVLIYLILSRGAIRLVPSGVASMAL